MAELHRMGVVHGDLRIDQFMLSSSTGGDGSEGRRVEYAAEQLGVEPRKEPRHAP